MSATQWTEGRMRHELLSGINEVMKASNCTLTSLEISYASPVERAGLGSSQPLPPARGPGDRPGDQGRLPGARQAGPGGRRPRGSHRAKAAEYQRKAALATDPRDRSGYEQLAAQELQKAAAR